MVRTLKQIRGGIFIILSALLMVALLTITGLGTKVYALNTYDSADLISAGDTKTLTLSNGNEYYYKFTPSEDGVYNLVSKGDSGDPDVNFEEWNDKESRYDVISQDIRAGMFNLKCQAEAGRTYWFKIKMYGTTSTFEVSLTKLFNGISYTPAKPVKLIKDEDGWYDDVQNYFHYDPWYYDVRRDGDKLTVSTDSGDDDYVYDSDENAYVGENGSIYSHDVYVDDDQVINHWEKGKDNFFRVRYQGGMCMVPVEIIENPISDIVFEPKNSYEFYFGTGIDDTDIDGNTFERFLLPAFETGDKLIVTEDGVKKTYVLDTRDWRFYNQKDPSDAISSSALNRDSDCQKAKPWVKGADNKLLFTYKGVSYELPVSVMDDPVTGIEYTPAEPIELIEEVDGYYDSSDVFWYHDPHARHGDKLTLKTANGNKDYFFDQSIGEFTSQAGSPIREYEVYISADDSSKWKINQNNSVTIKYRGMSCSVRVYIVPNTVTAISFKPAYDYVLSENEKQPWGYNLPGYVNGDELSVFRGTDEKVYKYNSYSDCFVNVDDDTDYIYAYNITKTDDQHHKPWIVDGENEFTLEYMNQKCKVPVKIKAESDVRLAEVNIAKELLDAVKNLNSDDYTQESFDYFMGRKNILNEYISDSTKTANNIRNARINLSIAVKMLVTKDEQERYRAVNKANRAIRQTDRLDAADYSEDSYKALSDAVAELEALISDSTSTAEDIKTATQAVYDAIDALKTVEEDEAQKRAEAIASANEAIAKAKALNASEYTADSFGAVTTALTALEAVIGDSTADSGAINAGVATLNGAIAALQKVYQPPVVKKPQPMQVSAKNKTFKAAKLKKKKVVLKALTVKGAEGDVTYTVKGNKKALKALKFNKKNGKITVKKGTKKGKYVLTITVNAAGNNLYEAGTQTVKITVKVK